MLPQVVPSGQEAINLRRLVPLDSALRPEGLLHTRGVAASGFPPLRNIPHCCLPQESGPCLSPSVADHPLRPANHLRLGRPLPHQLPNGTRAHPQVTGPKIPIFSHVPVGLWSHAVLAPLSKCYPPPEGRLPTRYSPVRHSTRAEALSRSTCMC